MAGRPPKEKSFANMLRIAINEAHEDGNNKLRAVAEALVSKAITGDVQAIREIADRIDGRVPQAVVGDDGFDPISLDIGARDLAKATAFILAKGMKDNGSSD